MFNIYMFKDKFLKSVHGVEVVSGVNLDGWGGIHNTYLPYLNMFIIMCISCMKVMNSHTVILLLSRICHGFWRVFRHFKYVKF